MTTKSESNRPTHIIWQVIGQDAKARWIRIGAAWENRDSKGMNLQFDAYPTTGRIVVREKTATSENGEGQQ